jgi:hypothetical protein
MASRNRGNPKKKISDLSRSPPTSEELEALRNALSTKLHPISAAVLGAVLVEHELDNELRRRIQCTEEAWKELISDIGPFRSFHAKIIMGYALNMYPRDMCDNLHIVRNIRNQFAHATRLVDFNHELVTTELKKAKPIRSIKKDFRIFVKNNNSTQDAYISLCMLLAIVLIKRSTVSAMATTRRLKQTARRLKQEFMKTSPWRNALLDVLDPPPNEQGGPLLSRLSGQNADPTSSTHRPSREGLLGLGEDVPRTKNK